MMHCSSSYPRVLCAGVATSAHTPGQALPQAHRVTLVGSSVRDWSLDVMKIITQQGQSGMSPKWRKMLLAISRPLCRQLTALSNDSNTDNFSTNTNQPYVHVSARNSKIFNQFSTEWSLGEVS